MWPLRSPPGKKRDWGWPAPIKTLYACSALSLLWKGCTFFLWFFLRIVVFQDGIPIYLVNLSPEIVSILSHTPNLWIYMNFSKSVELKKNSLDRKFYFDVLNKVHLMIYSNFVSIMTFIDPTELSENTINVVCTKSVSILSPTSVQNIIKFNWKWIFHVVILYQFQGWRKFMKNWLFLIGFCTLT